MANMRSYITRCTNEGEKKVFTFFEENLPDDCIAWSNINLIARGEGGVEEAEVDFLVHHPEIGLMMFEVKDWRADQINRVSRDSIYVGKNNKRYRNPYDYTKRKSHTLKTRMEGYKDFRKEDGRIKTPINVAIIFPYITRKEWEDTLTLLDEVDTYSCGLPPEKILFKEDIEDKAVSGKKSLEILGKIKDLRASSLTFESTLADEDLGLLDDLLGKPEGKESLYKEMTAKHAILADKKLIALNDKQKEKASQFLEMVKTSPGHLVIRGVAGGGKTIVLLHLFSLVARDPDARIAYIGRQRELVESFKENLRGQGMDPENSYYSVKTFHEFFLKYFPVDKYPDMGRSKNGYPDEEELKNFIVHHLDKIDEEYDFMFIDEGHNLPDEWIKMLVLKTKGTQNGNLVYVEDFDQNIYGIKRNFDNAFLGNRQEELNINYRNTVEIQSFALKFTDKDRKIDVVADKKFMRPGPMPEVLYSDSRSKTAYNLATKVEKWIREDKVPPEEIAIIYASSEGDDDSLVKSVITACRMKHIKLLSHYATGDRIDTKFPGHNNTILPSRKDGRRVENFDLSANFITAFSCQGMSYRCVAVLVENFEMEERWDKAQSRNLLYIALTRATHELGLVFGKCDTACSKALLLVDQLNKG
jgi:hypothetical protein